MAGPAHACILPLTVANPVPRPLHYSSWLCLLAVLTVGGCASLPDELSRHSGDAGLVGVSGNEESEATIENLGVGATPYQKQLAGLRQIGEQPSLENALHLLVDGPATFDTMFADLERARRNILLESYIFEDSELGQRVAEVLRRKRRAGVDVRVIYDSVGSLATPIEFFDDLRRAGVAVCEFNPVSAFRRRIGIVDVNHRDHRKLLIVDDDVGFTGGINISGVYSSSAFGSKRRADKSFSKDEGPGWRDTHVRVKGPAVRQMYASFAKTWNGQKCGEDRGEASAPLPTLPELPRALGNFADQRLVFVIDSEGDGDSTRFYRALMAAITQASASIRITMGYFVPDEQLIAALQAAARRGVRTELVLPGHSDSLLVLRAGQNRYSELLAAGVQIYEQRENFLHAKTAVIDGVWSTIGSSNLDLRSFLHNDELNVIVLDARFGAEMEKLFAVDRQHAVPVSLEDWEKRGIGRRLQETFSWFWQYWL